jgi:hypothetical protein
MQHELTILTKTKETIRYCELHAYGGKSALNTRFYHLTQVSVPTEDGSQQLATFTHVLKGSKSYVPTHAPSGLVLSCPLQVLQAKHKHKNPHKQQNKTFTVLIVLLKPQTIN